MKNSRSLAKDLESDGGSDSLLESSYQASTCDLDTPENSQTDRQCKAHKQKSISRSTRKLVPIAIARPEICARHKLAPEQTFCLVARTNGQHRLLQQQLQKQQTSSRRKRTHTDAAISENERPTRNRPVVILKDVSPASKRKDINIVLHKNKNVTISNQSPCASKDASINTMPVTFAPSSNPLQDSTSDAETDSSQLVNQLTEFIKTQKTTTTGNKSNDLLPKQLSEQLQTLSELAIRTQSDLQRLAKHTEEQLSQIAKVTFQNSFCGKSDKSSDVRSDEEVSDPSLSVRHPPSRSQVSMSSVLQMLMPILDMVGTIASDEARKKQQENSQGKSRVSFQPMNKDFLDAEERTEQESNWTDICTANAQDCESDQTLMPRLSTKDSRTRLKSLVHERPKVSTEQFKEQCEDLVRRSMRDLARTRNIGSQYTDTTTSKQQVCVDIMQKAVDKMKQTVGASNENIMNSALQEVLGKRFNATDSTTDELLDQPVLNQYRPTVKSDNLLGNHFLDARTKHLSYKGKEDPAAAAMCKMVQNLNQAIKDISDERLAQDRLRSSSSLKLDGDLKAKCGHTSIPSQTTDSFGSSESLFRLMQERRTKRNSETTK